MGVLGVKKLAIFCGAGISRNSGLLLASEVKKRILKILLEDTIDIDEIMDSNLPFEAFMQIIWENFDISSILDLFELGEPNTTHIFIAKLAKFGYIRTIVTTNFDLLIEKALEQEGLKEGVDFSKYYTEEHFSKVNYEEIDDKISLFKIHGSVDDKASTRVIIKLVASVHFSKARMDVIRHIFSTGNHDIALLLGYSCSDFFDISPQILSIQEPKTEIVFIEHSIDNDDFPIIEDINLKAEKNPFKNFSGKRVIFNTDILIKDLWNSLEKVIGTYVNKEITVSYETMDESDFCLRFPPFHTFIQHVGGSPGIKKYVVGELFLSISEFKKAIDYFKEALEIFNKIQHEKGQSRCYMRLGVTLGHLNSSKAIQCIKKASEFILKIDNEAEKFNYYINNGNCYLLIKKPKKAKTFFNKAWSIAAKNEDGIIATSCAVGFGLANSQLGKYPEALKWYNKGILGAQAVGDKEAESICLMNTGVVYRKLSDSAPSRELFETTLHLSKESFENAQQIAIQIGNPSLQSRCYLNIGNVHRRLNDAKQADGYYHKALKLAQIIGDLFLESSCYKSLGDLYTELGEIQKADKFLQKERVILEKAKFSSIITNEDYNTIK